MALTEYVIMPGRDYQAACDAIREKTGKTDLLKSGDLAVEIGGIVGGPSGPDTSGDTVTPEAMLEGVTAHNASGERIVGTIQAYDGEIGENMAPILFQEKTVTENGEVTPDEGYDGLSKVMVEIPSAVLQEKTVTHNGTVLPDEGYDGLSKVVVNVEGAMTEEDAVAAFILEQRKTSGIMSYMFFYCRLLTTAPLFDTSNVTDMSNMFNTCTSLTTVPLFDTSNVTFMGGMFYGCSSLTTVPLFDTSKVIDMRSMFADCSSLTTVPLFDTSKVTNMNSMFSRCTSLTTVPLFDTSNVTDMGNMFTVCRSLTTIPSFDMRKVTVADNIITNGFALTECWLRNIKTNLRIGSGSEWGELLTVESLIHLIRELRDTGSTKTLTMGNVNLGKIANTYVRLVDITDEMRAEDDLIDEKLPFELCESTDEGAMLITDYVAEKNWALA